MRVWQRTHSNRGVAQPSWAPDRDIRHAAMAKGKRVLPTDSADSRTHASGTATPLDTTISATGNASDFNGTVADLDPVSTRHDDPSRDDPCRLGRRLPSLDGAALLPWLDSSNRYGCPFVEPCGQSHEVIYSRAYHHHAVSHATQHAGGGAARRSLWSGCVRTLVGKPTVDVAERCTYA